MLNMWNGGLNPLYPGLSPGHVGGPFGAMQVIVQDAQQQRRTPLYRTDIWIRPGRVPSKLAGRRGTRRAWKRKHPPHWLWAHEEPTDVLVIQDRTVIATPAQYYAIRKAAK